MDVGWTASFALHWVLAILSCRVARRDRSHRPVAFYFIWVTATDFARVGIEQVLDPASDAGEGVLRAAFHADQLIVISWWFSLFALAAHYFLGRGVIRAAIASIAVWLWCLDYPRVSGESLADVLRLASLTATAGAWIVIFWGIRRRRELRTSLAHLVVILLAGEEVVLHIFPYLGDFVSEWHLVQWANVAILSICGAAHLRWLRAQEGSALDAA